MIEAMKREIELLDKKISYIFNPSRRTKNIRLTIKSDGSLTVSAPRHLDENRIRDFIKIKSKWIFDKLNYLAEHPGIVLSAGRGNLEEHKRGALKFVHSRLEYFNKIYQFKYSRVAVRSQKTRWGSCSRRGNLSFNYQVCLLPEKHADYIIVHELCHLGQLNHSKNFWQLVAKAVPDYKEIKKELKQIHLR